MITGHNMSDDIDLTGAEHKPDHRRGFLVFANLPPSVQAAEDSTAFADFEARGWRASVIRYRPATACEKALLAHVLGRAVPSNLQTRVHWLSNGVRNRSWPALGIGEDGVIT
jgi:hypothetical protein